MSKLRIHCFAISLDGFGAGPEQSLANPLGIGAQALHEWYVSTRTFQQLFKRPGGKTGPDDDFAARGAEMVQRLQALRPYVTYPPAGGGLR